MSKWYSVSVCCTKDVVVNADDLDEAVELAKDEAFGIGDSVDIQEAYELRDDLVDNAKRLADEVIE